ncbi:hypothetical protein WKW50_25560 [Ochrobactrum sp. GPK 3]
MKWKPIVFLSSAYYPASIGTLLTTLIGISTLQNDNPFLSSSVFALPFLITIFAAPLVARIIKNISAKKILKIQYVSRAFIAVIVSLCCYFVYKKSIAVIYPYVILLTLLSADQVLTSEAPLLVNKVYKTHFSKTTAFGNLFTRGFQSVTPIIAAFIVAKHGEPIWVSVLAVSLCFGIIYPYVLSKYSNIDISPAAAEHKGRAKSNGNLFHDSKSWGWWFLYFNILVNLSQGAVAFVLISIDPKIDGPIYSSILYGAFLLIQILVVIGFIDFNKISARPSTVVTLLLINSCGLVALAFLNNFSLIAGAVFLIGLIYGVSVPLLSDVILGRLRGPNFREHLANAKSGGRLASVLALWVAGLALSTGVSSAQLLLICGFLLAISAWGLFNYASRLEKTEIISAT